jgi:hypothetical protein
MRTERSDLVCRGLLLRGPPPVSPAMTLALGGEETWNLPALVVAGAVAQAVSLASAAANRGTGPGGSPGPGDLTARPSAGYYET